MSNIALFLFKTDLYRKQIRHRLHFKCSTTGLRKTFRNRKSQPASAIGTALIPSCKTCGKIHILFYSLRDVLRISATAAFFSVFNEI